MKSVCIAAALAALFLAPAALAQDAPKPETKAEAPIPPPNVSVTSHSGRFGGVAIDYVATTGETYLTDKDGKPTAAIFSTSYVKAGKPDPNRPVTFLFNGGPGSGSVWLHMGAFGPKRVVVPSDAKDDAAPPYPIVDNPMSLLDVTDIVFIDPVGTGFSKALGKTDPKEFWGLTADARSVAQFIRIWLRENGRWNSPKYLGGESYGTTRSAAVVDQLEGAYNDVSLNGILLISTILDFGAQAESPGNEMAYVVTLPSMAATAWYHGKLADKPPGVEAFVEEARAFAVGEYAGALLKGNRLKDPERAAVRAKLSRFTGLSEAYLDRAELRVTAGRFYKELLRDRGLTVGRLDSRYTGVDYDSAGEEPDNDPSFYGIDGAYTAAINDYVRRDLKLKMDREYVTIGPVGPWDWRMGGDRDLDAYLNVTPYIAKAMRENSSLRVFVGQGWYDFATPFFGAEYALSRTGVPADRVSFRYYDAGHMMYVREADLAKLSTDIRAFIRAGAK
ncbi:peptidase S10 [Phenylobacterium sp. LH3H17]|uniref:S10 family peptidase n=1 Tax=Phenylobacterium sp. LH3H17 TaxID=2903901 RepID=UPI0020C9B9D3|nr:peptidase S10 [Phenylobacterium sp. LH3H17]UTP40880.1 peptidase S10 [Phenylobacterium sp. LH3H17]